MELFITKVSYCGKLPSPRQFLHHLFKPWLTVSNFRMKYCSLSLSATISYLRLSFRDGVKDWCAKKMFLMFQVKGITYFKRYLPKYLYIVRKKLTNLVRNLTFWWFYTIWQKKNVIFCFSALKLGISFVNKTKKTYLKLIG